MHIKPISDSDDNGVMIMKTIQNLKCECIAMRALEYSKRKNDNGKGKIHIDIDRMPETSMNCDEI